MYLAFSDAIKAAIPEISSGVPNLFIGIHVIIWSFNLSEAFKFGAPPHGGSAPGIDRILMLIAEEENLREVVAFPMNQQAEDLMMRSPNSVSTNSLDELGIDLKPDKKKKLT